MPWSGALAGVLFAFQETVAPFGEKVNDPNLTSTIAAASGRGYGAGFASLAAALMLYFFAAAARAVLLGVIGVCGPLAALVQIVLPLWLIVAAAVIARPQRSTMSAR